MGLADLVKEIREERSKDAGQRLFDFVRSFPPRTKQPMKAGDYFRISSLPYLCPREEVLASKNEIIRVQKLPPHLKITFDIGDYFHELYRNVYFGPMGEWVGAWECKRCGWDTDKVGLSAPPIYKNSPPKLARMPEKCPDCGAVRPRPCSCGEMMGVFCRNCGAVREGHSVDEDSDLRFDDILVFKEWRVSDPELRLWGHPDGWRWLPGAKPAIIDLKSHGSNGFKGRNSLREGHDLQVWGYQHCSGDTKTTGSVCYLNKSPWGDHSMFIRDIKVPFNERLFDSQIRRPLMDLQNGLAGGEVPDRICISPDCPRAKECQLVPVCWG